MKKIITGAALLSTMLLSAQLPVNTVVDAQTIPAAAASFLTQFEFVKKEMEGMLPRNPTNENIGFPEAFYDGWKNYYWQPVNGKKMAVCGRYYRFSIYDGESGIVTGNDSHEDEYDWNITIVPHASFSHIIQDVYNKTKTTSEWQTGKFDGRTYTALQGEITPDESLYNNPWFPNIGHEKSSYNVIAPTIGLYGPWIMDDNHNDRPEIHPCEIIWFRTKTTNRDEYHIFGIQDDSNRFDERGNFQSSKPFPAGWQPWAAPPITSEFKIPFEYNGKFSDHLVVNIEQLRAKNVVTSNFAEGTDSDDGQQHQLMFKTAGKFDVTAAAAIRASTVLVTVNENIPNPADLGVRFVDLRKKPDGTIVGYIQIFTAYGKGIAGTEGYHIIKVTLDYPKMKLPTDVIQPDKKLPERIIKKNTGKVGVKEN